MSEDGEATHWSGRAAFAEAIGTALQQAVELGERTLHWVDADFATWPLNDRHLADLLTQWAAPRRRLVLLARHFDEMPRRHPRFVVWRRTWSHLVQCRAAPEVDVDNFPTLFLAGRHSFQRLDLLQMRGRWLRTERERRPFEERVDALLQRSEEAFPSDMLGL